MNIPEFKSTNEAYDYGIIASDEQCKILSELREVFKEKCTRCIDEEKWNKASIYATKSQFCREAIEAHSGQLVIH